ncbi:Peptidase-S15 domain-containing protein [Mycena kentingensis (nom. inval.)]|nr:Peptidase-S15 domain-containing protein [Mycena kentingensis (nom. inval.)]
MLSLSPVCCCTTSTPERTSPVPDKPPNERQKDATESPSIHPVVVMANGLGCTKLLGLGPYAEAFAAEGYACIVFDYRRWGASDGTRRNSVYVDEQQADYRAVVKWARQQPEYDPQRIVLWGFSFAGGHVLTLASDPALNPAASIALNPFCGRSMPPFQFTGRYLSLSLLGLIDFAADYLGLPPVYIPAVGAPGSWTSALAAPGAVEGFASVTERDGDFPNQINASIFFRAPWHNKPRAALSNIHNPILLLAARNDHICPPAPIVEIATKCNVESAELLELEGDHFDAFRGNGDWDAALAGQIAFLQKQVPV